MDQSDTSYKISRLTAKNVRLSHGVNMGPGMSHCNLKLAPPKN